MFSYWLLLPFLVGAVCGFLIKFADIRQWWSKSRWKDAYEIGMIVPLLLVSATLPSVLGLTDDILPYVVFLVAESLMYFWGTNAVIMLFARNRERSQSKMGGGDGAGGTGS